jgi:Dolichyl-phosphate-mannose-protein mannosyltransferase
MIARISAVVCVIAAAWAAYLQVHGGYDARILGIRVRTNDASRLVYVSLSAGLVWLGLYGVGRALADLNRGIAWLVRQLARLDDRLIVAALALAVVVMGLEWGSKAAGGADSYGYLSEAELFLRGHLTISFPWLADIPWASAQSHFSPLGYRPGLSPTEIVPKYAPGLPMLMALAKAIGGQAGIFWVVPLSGGLLVLATLGIGRRLGSSRAGMLAAWLVATSPALLYQLMQPMSDVPVAAAWAIAFWCLFGRGVGSTAAAGLATGIAILIRPNLAPMAAVPAVWLCISVWRDRSAPWRPKLMRLAAFGLGPALGILATAALNKLWYGSPFRSGYETFDALFNWSNLAPNLRNYFVWFVETQTPLALLGVVALMLPLSRLWPAGVARGRVVVGTLFVLTVWMEYCAYVPFDVWWYLRFMLPCWPFLMLGLSVALLWPVQSSRPLLTLGIILLTVAIGAHGIWFAKHSSAFELQRGEDKYPTIAKLVQRRTEANSIIFSMQHSGSIRYYGGRMTLSFYTLDANMLDRSVRWFTERGVHPYALLEDWEAEEFKQRFSDINVMGKLLMPPTLIYHGSATAYLYDFWRPAASRDTVEAFVDPPDKPVLCLAPVPLNSPTFKF